MKYLAIDTSGSNLTVLVCNQDKIYKFYDQNCGVNHSVAVMGRLEQLVLDAKLDLADVDFFAVVTGAGSFTGIRIGVATVKALCFAYKKPCLNITSFDTLAYNTLGGKVLAVIDAKHDGFYVCGYDGEAVCFPPSYLLKQDLLKLKGEYLFAGDFDAEFIDKRVDVCDGLIRAVEKKSHLATFDLDSVVPLYVRKSQAEEGR